MTPQPLDLLLRRIHQATAYTIGRLEIDGRHFCDTLEDPVRPIAADGTGKIAGQTAIPPGRYEITLSVVSPRFSRVAAYAAIGARMPRLLNVPHFSGVLIHPGNTAADTEGCILVGHNTLRGRLTQSRDTFFALYDLLKAATLQGRRIYITVQ